jgi:hypothetical protein
VKTFFNYYNKIFENSVLCRTHLVCLKFYKFILALRSPLFIKIFLNIYRIIQLRSTCLSSKYNDKLSINYCNYFSLANRNSKFEVIIKKSKYIIQELEFDNCSVIEFIPHEILNVLDPKMMRLDFFSSFIPILKTQIFAPQFSLVEELEISYCNLEEIAPTALSGLTKLTSINLSHNKLEEIPHKIFENNINLVTINLSYNKITLVHPEIFNNLKKLKRITIDQKSRYNTFENNTKNFNEAFKSMFDEYVKKYGETTEIKHQKQVAASEAVSQYTFKSSNIIFYQNTFHLTSGKPRFAGSTDEH